MFYEHLKLPKYSWTLSFWTFNLCQKSDEHWLMDIQGHSMFINQGLWTFTSVHKKRRMFTKKKPMVEPQCFFAQTRSFFAKKSAQIKNQLFKSAQIWLLRCHQNRESAQLRVLRYSKITKSAQFRVLSLVLNPERCSALGAQKTPFFKNLLPPSYSARINNRLP